jgi:mycoredoxin
VSGRVTHDVVNFGLMTTGFSLMTRRDKSRMSHQLTLYSTPWCGYCHRLKGQLEREGITFIEVDIEQQPDAALIVEEVNRGNQTVPTLVFEDGTALTNPSLAQVKAKLAA